MSNISYELLVNTFDVWDGWKLAIVVPPAGGHGWWQAEAWWGPLPHTGMFNTDVPQYFLLGAGPTRAEAVADLFARCKANPRWNTVVEPFE